MKIIGVIPARFASSRFPGKPLALIEGRPMIQWVIEGVRTSRLLSDVIVATDHPEIQKACQQVGCHSVMTTSDLPSGTDRIYEAVQNISADVVINIQGDEPLINQTWIDPLAKVFTQGSSVEMATLAHPLEDEDLQNPNAVKVIVNQKSEAIYFSRFPIPYSRHSAKEMGEPLLCSKHIGMYGYRRDFLKKFCQAPASGIEKAEALEQLRALDLGAKIQVIFVEKPTLGVDTPEDLKKVTEWLKKRGSHG